MNFDLLKDYRSVIGKLINTHTHNFVPVWVFTPDINSIIIIHLILYLRLSSHINYNPSKCGHIARGLPRSGHLPETPWKYKITN